MKVPDEGVPVDTLISVIKDSVKRAGVSRTSHTRDLQVASVELILEVVASKTAGGRLFDLIYGDDHPCITRSASSVRPWHLSNTTASPPSPCGPVPAHPTPECQGRRPHPATRALLSHVHDASLPRPDRTDPETT